MNARELAVRATRVSGMQKLEELYPLICFVALNPPCRVLELGSARGGTFLAWCELATSYAVIVSVDLEHSDTNVERMQSFVHPNQAAKFVKGDTHDPDIRRQVEDLLGYVDLLHIDADHSEAAVRADWEDYHELLCPGGLAVFHDISDGGPIGSLWSELASKFWNIKFIEANGNDGWGGIGVLRI
jgi:cephalosporin hydroxylase